MTSLLLVLLNEINQKGSTKDMHKEIYDRKKMTISGDQGSRPDESQGARRLVFISTVFYLGKTKHTHKIRTSNKWTVKTNTKELMITAPNTNLVDLVQSKEMHKL